MKLTAKAVFFPAIIAIVFVVIPRIAFRLFPAGVEEVVSIIFDVNALILTLTVVGVALAAISLVKNTTDSWSPANLLAGIASELIGLYLFIFFIGLGDVSGLGATVKSVPGGATIWWDFRVFVLFQFLITGLTIARSGLKFYSARKARPQPPQQL